MARILFYILAAFILFRVFRWILKVSKTSQLGSSTSDSAARVDDVLVTDPVDGIRVPRSEALTETINGETYYFANEDNRKKFIAFRKGNG